MSAQVVDLDRLRKSCAQCSLQVLCLPAGIGGDDLQQLDDIVRNKRPLEQGETLSQFVESAVRSVVERRKHQAEFVRRGVTAIQETQRTDSGIPAAQVVARLQARLEEARQTRSRRGE